jgi:hypothetical protein
VAPTGATGVAVQFRTQMNRMYIGVVVCEAVVIAMLWAFSRAFA